MEILNKHATIRNFTDKQLSTELLTSIIYSGTRASTTGNMQLYSIIINRDEKVINELLPLHFNQLAARNAPVLLTFVADFNRFVKWCQINRAKQGFNNFLSFFNAAIDAILVAQNVCIAAENNGLGICYLGTTTYNAREIISILKLPKLTFPVTTIAIGYPYEAPGLTDRIPLDGIIHEENYNEYSVAEINDLYALKESLNSSIQFVNKNGLENLAQVYTDVRYKKTDNEFFSEKMISTIKEQGFRF